MSGVRIKGKSTCLLLLPVYHVHSNNASVFIPLTDKL
nr:MAG TPA: hypothetical protein [Caudoviricetes sp.]